MEINIKLKFDPKKQKGQIWQKHKKSFFLQNTQFKNKSKSPEAKQHHQSFREFAHSAIPDHNPLTHRQRSKDINMIHGRKTSKSKKKSKGKNSKQSYQSQNRKSSQIKKNISDVIKIPKKKFSIVNSSNFMEEQTFRGSLPGLSGKKVLQRFAPLLSENQKIQLINEKTVYYIGIGAQPGQDDLQGSYLWRKHEQVGYRYQLLQCLGSGAFGEVAKAFDHKTKETVALKIIRSKKQHMQLALNEINILMRAKQKDIDNQKNVVRIKDFIVFRKHICIVTELLSISLYDLLENSNFKPIDMQYIRTFAIQIFNALAFLKQHHIIHSDIKPENVLLKNRSKTGIKLIDFGTSMFTHEATYMYIQSRFYRAPQVILGASYDYGIDMWSVGCLLAQLYLGSPLFAGSNEQQQLSLIMQMVGTPPKQYLKNCKNCDSYFREEYVPKIIKSKNGKAIIPGSKPLSLQIQEKGFAEFLAKIFVFNTSKRLTPLQALLEPWIVDSLPETIKEQHLSYIKLKLKKLYEMQQEKKSPSKNTVKKHMKRNSDFCTNQKQIKHKRRRSDGMN